MPARRVVTHLTSLYQSNPDIDAAEAARSRSRDRYRMVVRQWQMLRVMAEHSRGISLARITQLAGAGVTDRTMRRDLEALEAAGFPIEMFRPSWASEVRWRLNIESWCGELLARRRAGGGQ